MNKESLRRYLNARYQGSKSFLDNVIFPIFGSDNFEDSFGTELLDNQPETRKLAETTGIHSVKQLGVMDIDLDRLYVFDVTVLDRVKMERNRVNIQRLIRAVMSYYSSAFMIFHYADDVRGDWRFTFCHKGGTNNDATDSKRYTFLLGPGQSCRTAADNFLTLFAKRDALSIPDIESAFDVEALSKEFFDKYKEQYERFVEHITGKRFVKVEGKWVEKVTREPHPQMYKDFGCDDKKVRDYVKKLLGRIVFLHFLQKKGWMGVPADKTWGDGDLQFMKHLFDNASAAQQDNFLDEVLEPLFSDGLDTDRSADNDLFDTRTLGELKIPYLNGGLFVHDSLDEVPTAFQAGYFADLFDFFYQYNFTIDENDPNDAQVGVDPEMLGRIFENLLEDNKDKGAFYTPKDIVQYMCRQSLVAYLQTDYSGINTKQAIADFVGTYDVSHLGGADTDLARSIDQLLKDVKICDPAIGSGAFPMGLLKELFLCRGVLEDFKDAADIKRHIIQNNIYGVDIERGAVDIARLRFWLSLVVDETTPHSLPNLDYKIMQGNSLLESYDGVDLSKLDFDHKVADTPDEPLIFGGFGNKRLSGTYAKAENLEELRSDICNYYSSKDHSLKCKTRECINTNIKDIITRNIDMRIEQQRCFADASRDRVDGANAKMDNLKQIFHDKVPAKALNELNAKIRKEQATAEALEVTIDKMQEALDTMLSLDISANPYFFLWHIWFSEVFNDQAKGGFDIVIGNPPYVEAKKLKYIASTLKQQYAIYSGTADFSVYFIEQGVNLLKKNGILSFIMTNKFFNTGYGRPVRKFISQRTINQLINFEQVEVFEGILVSSVILNIRNCPQKPNNEFVYERFYRLKAKEFKEDFVGRQNIFGVYQQQYLDDKEWSFSDSVGLLIKSKIENNATLLKDLTGVSVYRGVTTGYNPAFIITDETRDELIAKDTKNADVIKNLLQGRNIRKWYYNESSENIIFTRRGFIITDFPFIESYLSSFYNQLKPKIHSTDKEGRKPGRYNWYEIMDNTAYYPEFEKPEKIIWGLTADKWAFAYDDQQHYLPSNGYILTSDDIPIKYLLGILNSNLMRYYFNFIGVMTAGGAYTLKAATIESLPIIIAADQTPIINLVDRILGLKSADTQADTSADEARIDELVYQLYGLTDEEIKICVASG